ARLGTMKPANGKPQTMFEKIWDAHLVRAETADTPAILYVDLHLVHEVTSPQAFTWLREKSLKVRRPERTVATMDHSTPTTPRGGARAVDGGAHDGLQHVDRGGRARGHDRARRDDVRLPEGPSARAVGRGVGAGGRGLAAASVGRRRRVRPRGEAGCVQAGAD